MKNKKKFKRLLIILLLLLLLLLSVTILSAQSEETNDHPVYLPLIASGSFDDVTEGEDYVIIEGDIQVSREFYEQLVNSQLGAASTYLPTQASLWPNGIVPFEFAATVTTANRTLMLAAMADWEATANIDFRPRNGEVAHVLIQNSSANNSPVGWANEQRVINILNWNYHFIMMHELAHTLGYWHEQSRSDRNNFVIIRWEHIIDEEEHNFALKTDAGRYGTYDFDSLMHYGACDFVLPTLTCPDDYTIQVREPYSDTWQQTIGQRDHLSRLDGLTMSFLYPEQNWRFVDSNYTGSGVGTFLQPVRSLALGVTNTPSNGVLWIQPGDYSAIGVYNKPLTLQAPLGGVMLGN